MFLKTEGQYSFPVQFFLLDVALGFWEIFIYNISRTSLEVVNLFMLKSHFSWSVLKSRGRLPRNPAMSLVYQGSAHLNDASFWLLMVSLCSLVMFSNSLVSQYWPQVVRAGKAMYHNTQSTTEISRSCRKGKSLWSSFLTPISSPRPFFSREIGPSCEMRSKEWMSTLRKTGTTPTLQ